MTNPQNMDKRVVQQLIKARKTVKQKYQSLKSDMNIRPQLDIASIYEPITAPLKELVAKINVNKCEVKDECKKELPQETETKEEIKPHPISKSPSAVKPPLQFLKDENVFESEPKHETSTSISDVSGEYLGTTMREDLESFLELYGDEYLKDLAEPLPKIYVKEMINEEVQEKEENYSFDHNFGPRHDFETAKFSLGDVELDFKGPNFIIKLKNGTRLEYEGTPGLYELVFKKHPIGFKQKDIDNYIDIGMRSNLFRRNYQPDEQINGNSSYKYVDIIEPGLRKKKILQPKKSIKYTREIAGLKYKGKGSVLQLNNTPIEYVHWTDPNQLVDRLRLLVASRAAGNNHHGNEITSIIQELRDAGLIK